MLLLSRFLQRFHKNEKQTSERSDPDIPCIGDKGKLCRCKILLLDDTELVLDYKTGAKAHLLLEKVFNSLNLIEKDYFGLRFLDQTNQTQWLDPTKSIGPQVKGLSQVTLYFGVKFYAADPCKLHEEITRYQFFLQVKRDVLQGRLPVSFDLASELAAYVVQSELGDYDPKRYSYGYVSEFRFIPNQTEEFENRVMQIHRTLMGQVPASAEFRYLDKVKWMEMYGVDLHPVQGEGSLEYFLCLTPTGVVVYRNKQKVGNYFWPRITKITFKGKMFLLRVKDKNNDENTYAFECTNKNACKHLWKCCVEHHAFFRLTSASESYNGASSGKLFNLGSKYRYSGRTEKQVLTDAMNRPAPQVVRTPSKRHQRRASTGAESVPELGVMQLESESIVVTPEPVNKHRQRTGHKREAGYQSAPESPRSARSSAPWENGGQRITGGLFTSTCPDSPGSLHSAKLFPGRRAGDSDVESVASSRRSRHHRRLESESENEVSHRRHRDHRSRCPAETDGSESESNAARRMRKYRKSAENLTYSEAHWQNVQSRIRDGGAATAGAAGAAGQGPFALRSSAHGSMTSMASEMSAASKRARRRRSKSPSNKQPPAELAQHFKYVDPETEGIDMKDFDLQFTTVETELAPVKIKHRSRSRDRKSHGSTTGLTVENPPSPEAPKNTTIMPEGEPPPPYSDNTPVKQQPPTAMVHPHQHRQLHSQGTSTASHVQAGSSSTHNSHQSHSHQHSHHHSHRHSSASSSSHYHHQHHNNHQPSQQHQYSMYPQQGYQHHPQHHPPQYNQPAHLHHNQPAQSHVSTGAYDMRAGYPASSSASSQPKDNHRSYHPENPNDTMRSPVSVQINSTYTAPIVKTKPVALMTPPKQQAPVPTTQVIYGQSGNSAVVSASQQTFQPIQTTIMPSHARDDSGVGIESPQDSSSQNSSQQTTPTGHGQKSTYIEQVSSDVPKLTVTTASTGYNTYTTTAANNNAASSKYKYTSSKYNNLTSRSSSSLPKGANSATTNYYGMTNGHIVSSKQQGTRTKSEKMTEL